MTTFMPAHLEKIIQTEGQEPRKIYVMCRTERGMGGRTYCGEQEQTCADRGTNGTCRYLPGQRMQQR
ncbi:MAG: hypothetical protein KKF46_05970 [Nanoarchaeota archaeon]|nr:hypothetical protein [Nanoarchaeota archaeon]MBU1321880.1 hypothetical protein [Nanoarchaeota archaeon]MBU1597655.1 hypothetical protein [Nanoarchaeota archaeon]MBU2442218.1 hypothetical protein [Nanoarchaeota archaeon]